MDKTCSNCGWNISLDSIIECNNLDITIHDNCNIDNKFWKPKENEMEKIIMTEEQARELFLRVPFEGFDRYNFDTFYNCLDEAGHIKKSDLEQARDAYKKVNHIQYNETSEYIDELEKEIARIKT